MKKKMKKKMLINIIQTQKIKKMIKKKKIKLTLSIKRVSSIVLSKVNSHNLFL